MCLNHFTYQTHYCIFRRRILPWGCLKKAEKCRRISTCFYTVVTNSIAVVEIYMVARYLSWKGREHLVVSDLWWVTLVFYVMCQLSGLDLHHHLSCLSSVGRRRIGANFVWRDSYHVHSFRCWHTLWMCSDDGFSFATYIYNLWITCVNENQFYYVPRTAV
jgi:hypothetical protein